MARRKSTPMKPRAAKSRGADARPSGNASTGVPPQGSLGVRKAYKMYLGGAFVRSESGRYFQVQETKRKGGSGTMENVPLGSRKDIRDAVRSAHEAYAGWAKRVATNRGQILYRLAEMTDARRAELQNSLERSGVVAAEANREVSATVDRIVAYAGWADKYQSLFSSLNPVAGPHFDFTLPESMGVVGVVAPDRPSLLGLVSVMLPVIVAGNSCVVLASEVDPRTAISFSECLATSDLPGGVVNILTGRVNEMLPHLARHYEVAALDLHNLPIELSKEMEVLAADSVKRVRVRALSSNTWFDADACESPRWIERFVEMKTIWHPSGG